MTTIETKPFTSDEIRNLGADCLVELYEDAFPNNFINATDNQINAFLWGVSHKPMHLDSLLFIAREYFSAHGKILVSE